jgi:hypothetical protein
VAAVDGNQHDDTKQKQPGETAGDAGKYLRPGRCIAPARIGWFVCYGRGDVPEAFAARLFVAIEVGSTGTSTERTSPAANTPVCKRGRGCPSVRAIPQRRDYAYGHGDQDRCHAQESRPLQRPSCIRLRLGCPLGFTAADSAKTGHHPSRPLTRI